jgi:DNA-binding NarL/FixJ family response regulator
MNLTLDLGTVEAPVEDIPNAGTSGGNPMAIEDERTVRAEEAEARIFTAIVADDHEAARSRIRELLEDRGIRVVAEFTNGELALDAVLHLRPQLVTVDIRMPGLGGLAVAERIKQECPQTRVFVVTNYPNQHYRRAAEKAGADAFIAKSEAYEGFQTALRLCFGLSRAAAKDPAPED